MNDRQQRFIKLLEEIFEINKSDLDFGIYRILNIKRAEITEFFRNRLPQQIEQELAPFAASNNSDIQKRMAEIEAQLGGKQVIAQLPDSIPMAAEYRRLEQQKNDSFDMEALESDVYSALYSFFNRYYDEGDFISKRRYKEGVYALPYEGEEVKLYWANQDQYYIKTSENFKDYTFNADDISVHFRLVDATTEQNNNKESEDAKRVFMLFEPDEENYPGIETFSYNAEAKELIIRFLYNVPEDKKRKYDEENYKAIVSYIASELPELVSRLLKNVATKPTDNYPLIKKHLDGYVAKNTFDYFIHKDLKGFLSRELDFFIKNEILHIDDIESEDIDRNQVFFAKIRAIRKVARVIIDFLAQLENFQKKLWLKKKFVVETNWCITLDNIDEKFYPEIATNEAQIEDWIRLFAIDKIEADLNTPAFSRPLTVDFLKANQNLVLDTKNFSETFKDKIVASIDNLDNVTNGVMINSDNYHGLRLLSCKYGRSVKYIYIDPPYNAKSSTILYKNSFKHSSWLSLMQNRLEESFNFLQEDAVYTIAIDEVENAKLSCLNEEMFSKFSGNTEVSVIINPSGQQGKNFSTTNEYLHFYYDDVKDMLSKEIRDEESADVRGFMNGAKGEGGNYLRTSGKTCFYPIFVKDGNVVGFGDVCNDDFHPGSANVIHDDYIEIYPIDNDGVERKWLFGRDTVEGIIQELSVKRNRTTNLFEIIRTKSEINYKTVWTAPIYSAKEHGTNLLTKMFGKPVFSFAKSLYAVRECIDIACRNHKDANILDFFAGSGTTGHATISLNRHDKGNRKYILIEMGEYFTSATRPRIMKAVYAKSWNNGLPISRDSGVKQIIKYMRLESYEDALSNVVLKKNASVINFGDEYLINYMLDVESKDSLLNIDKFNEPFNFAMNITEKNESKVRHIDVVETFNYLIGLSVDSKSAVSIFASEPAANPLYEGAVDLRKDENGEYSFQQLEGSLPDGRRALVIWRNITNNILNSNAALDAYFQKYRINPRDREFDVIFVNGDNNLENLRLDEENWKVVMTEQEFNKRMWEE